MTPNTPRGGATTWYFPDGYLPEKKPDDTLDAHEALMMLNIASAPAKVTIDVYFENRDPIMGITQRVPAQRVVSLHLDRPEDLDGVTIPPLTQYALRVRSSLPIVATFGRLDTTQSNLAYYSPPCYCEP